ncbi:MAG: hypothetical protein GY835_28285, partial [bacterium]|nr:hypothetical protein [bacterium]
RTFFIICLLLCAVWAVGEADDGEASKPAEGAKIGTRVAPLLKLLDDDSFEIRQGAAAKLDELVSRKGLSEEFLKELSAEFHRTLLRTDISLEVRLHLKRWCGQLPPGQPEPDAEVSTAEIRRLVEQLEDDSYAIREGTDRRLRWLLCRDEHVPRVMLIIEERLKDNPGLAAKKRLQSVLDYARPAMVAEYWQNRRCRSQQYLLIGVPSLAEGAPRPSHFDRIDNKTAHCVSGSNLSPGDHPVGVAIPHPHPSLPGAFFHLVNLPTPQRRMAYEQSTGQGSDATRLAEISRRTLDKVLLEKRKLTDREIVILATLSRAEVSRFAGNYFCQIDDEQFAGASGLRVPVRGSRHGVICGLLALEGTKEAMPKLIEAIDKGSFLPPTSQNPYHLQWLAALAIAQRDPWAEVDDWLAGLIPRTDPLSEARPKGPQLGATAAAILLKRHQQTPRKFSLAPSKEAILQRFRLEGYNCGSPEAREAIQKWWKQQKEKEMGSEKAPG